MAWNKRRRVERRSIPLPNADELVVGGAEVEAAIHQSGAGEDLAGIQGGGGEGEIPEDLAIGAVEGEDFAGGGAEVEAFGVDGRAGIEGGRGWGFSRFRGRWSG